MAVRFFPAKGKAQTGRDAIFAQFHHIHGRNPYPMRSVITREYVYIFNPWSNGKRVYRAEPMSGLTFRTMKRASENDPRLAKRVRHFEYRTVEEFYDLKYDPYCLRRLAVGQKAKTPPAALRALQKRMRDWMVRHGDFALDAFDHRDSPEVLEQFLKDYTERSRKEVEALKPYEETKRYRF